MGGDSGLQLSTNQGEGSGLVLGDEEELEELRKALKAEKEKSAKLQAELDDTLNLFEEEKQARQAADEKVIELTNEIESLNSKIKELEERVAALESDLETEKKERAEEKEVFETKIAELESRIAVLEKELADEQA